MFPDWGSHRPDNREHSPHERPAEEERQREDSPGVGVIARTR
jgi:hypothetical protein